MGFPFPGLRGLGGEQGEGARGSNLRPWRGAFGRQRSSEKERKKQELAEVDGVAAAAVLRPGCLQRSRRGTCRVSIPAHGMARGDPRRRRRGTKLQASSAPRKISERQEIQRERPRGSGEEGNGGGGWEERESRARVWWVLLVEGGKGAGGEGGSMEWLRCGGESDRGGSRGRRDRARCTEVEEGCGLAGELGCWGGRWAGWPASPS